MEEQQVQSSAGEMMVFGLIEQADRIGKSALAIQRELAAQIQQLAQVQAGIQTAIQQLAAERVALGTMRPTLAGYAAKAMREAIAAESEGIQSRTELALRQPIEDIQQAASHVRDNVRETRWLTISLFVALGLALGFVFGYWLVNSRLSNLDERVTELTHQLQAPPAQSSTPSPGSQPSGKKHGQH